MGDIKSAWEIAQEKASKLGKLSATEREQQRQDKCRLAAEALADKFLSRQDIGVIKEDLSKQEAADRALIVKLAIRQLSQSIDIRYPDTLAIISQGILALSNAADIKKELDETKSLFEEYALAEEKERHDIEEAGSQLLHQMRISGSAIGRLNIRAIEGWQQRLDQITKPFGTRLDALKRQLQS